ncbi:MAG: DUF2905 domain-containing protein [Capsulimonadaceae bacterium]|nr:DUF2905 domain-containing protein [Capsulimonadaceae bacterium]
MGFIGIGKLLVFAGLVMAGAGGVIWLAGRAGFTGLPGDIKFSRGNSTVFIPIATSIALSILLTILLNLIVRFRR